MRPADASVSVVIPAFNRAAAVQAAVESVRRQSHARWEVVVVDDGSSDGTAARLAELASRDPRIRVLRHEANRGAQAARNSGVRAARGPWIAFLDSDDRFLPHSLASRLAEAAARDVCVVHSACEVLAGRPSDADVCVPAWRSRVYRRLLGAPGPMFQGLLVARDALLSIGGLDEAIVAYQEWDTSIRLAEHFEFGFVEQPTFIYDCRGRDRISGDLARSARGYEQVFRKHRAAVLRHAGAPVMARHYAALAKLYGAARDARAAWRYRVAAAAWSPFLVGSALWSRCVRPGRRSDQPSAK